jgi:hypothetical protein
MSQSCLSRGPIYEAELRRIILGGTGQVGGAAVEDTVRGIGFTRLAIFRPGIIVGNAHNPALASWLGSLVPGPFGNIDQRILGRSIAAERVLHNQEVVRLPSKMRQ